MDFKNRQGISAYVGVKERDGQRLRKVPGQEEQLQRNLNLSCHLGNRTERHNTNDILNLMKQTSAPCLPSHGNYLCVPRLL